MPRADYVSTNFYKTWASHLLNSPKDFTPFSITSVVTIPTQNANESLDNVNWNFCPKSRYLSPQSIRVSTAIAVAILNEGELCLYGYMRDLNLNLSYTFVRSALKREHVKIIIGNNLRKLISIDEHVNINSPSYAVKPTFYGKKVVVVASPVLLVRKHSLSPSEPAEVE